MERALPGRYIDLIRDGVSPAELKAKGRVAVWSALVQTAMSAQARGWDQTEWAALVLAPNSYLGYQAKSKGKDRTLPDMQVVKQMDNAWEKTWELRTSRDPAWTPEQARIEALERAQVAAKAVEDLYVDLTHAERLVLAYAGEQTRLRGFTNVALPRQAIYGATGLGSTAVATALKGLATKGLLHLHRTGQRAKSAKYRRASIYTLADARSLTLFIRDLTAPLPAGPDDGLASVTPIRTLSHRPLPTPAHGARDLLGAGVDLGHDGYPALSQQLPPFESSAVLAAARCRRGLWCWRGSCRAPVRALVEVPRVQPTRDHGCRQPGRACLMDRAKGEGNDPKDTVAIGGGTYRSTGRLYIVLPYKTRSERTYAALLVAGAWMYTDPGDDDRAWGLINERVTVTWKLAYGRRYIRRFGPMGAEEGSQSFGGRWRASQPSRVDSRAPSSLALPEGLEPDPGHEC